MQKRHQFKFSSIAFTFYFWSKTLHVIDFKFQETKISVEFPSFLLLDNQLTGVFPSYSNNVFIHGRLIYISEVFAISMSLRWIAESKHYGIKRLCYRYSLILCFQSEKWHNFSFGFILKQIGIWIKSRIMLTLYNRSLSPVVLVYAEICLIELFWYRVNSDKYV